MPSVLTLNGGSSSIRFGVYEAGEAPRARLVGKLERIGLSGTRLNLADPATGVRTTQPVAVGDFGAAVRFMVDWLGQYAGLAGLQATGHRVVHGLDHSQPQVVSPRLLAQLREFSSFDPDHLPGEIELIEAIAAGFPALPQVACFDTAFHHTLPPVARLLPVPRRLQRDGVRRYGFHGLSYAFLLHELRRVAGRVAADGKVILAHLGNGASLTAVEHGQSVETSMGFTPAGGIPMGTRSGDLDPGLVAYLMRQAALSPEEFNDMVNTQSGLLGVSETSSDMRDLLAAAPADARAAQAVEFFCYQARKCIGALAAVLGGVDTLVFAGGIGENASPVRERICRDLGFLGVELDADANERGAPVISRPASRVVVRVIPTNEEWMIARLTCQALGISVTPQEAGEAS